MKLSVASKKKAKIKMGLQGPSGSGKTKSALLIAYGLCGDWTKIAIVDSENHSADLYSELGPYNVLPLTAPFTPERFIQAMKVCINAGIEVMIIDSISHEWEGVGGVLDIHSNMLGNSFTNWSKVTPRHNDFVQYLLQSDVHIISTMRAKTEYVLSEKNGKQVPEKIGLKGITREGMDYEFTLVFEINQKHFATATKDRTSLFMDKPEFIPTIKTGKQILEWTLSGETPEPPETSIDDVLQAIAECTSNDELLALYNKYPHLQQSLSPEFTKRRREIALLHTPNNQTAIQNGIHTS